MDPMAAHAMLMHGLKTASLSVVEEAIGAGASVDGMPTISHQVPPICFASSRGQVDIIKALIRRGADLEIAPRDECDSTGEVFAAFVGGSIAIPWRRSRALHAAILGGTLEALRVLLEAGANPNSTDADGLTPLMVACGGCSGRPFCDSNVSTPMMAACSRESVWPLCHAEQRLEMLHALFNAGADPTVETLKGGLAIHFATTIGATQAIKVLLNRAPSTLNIANNNGYTPLAIAAYEGHESTVSFLLSAGAREPAVWTPGIVEQNALLVAVDRNQQHVVRILLDQGLEAVGEVAMVPEAIFISIQQGLINILRLLLRVQGEERQEYWVNHPVYHPRLKISSEFPAGTPLGRVKSILAARFGLPPLHLAAYWSLRAAHVLLSVGADETAVDAEGRRAIDMIFLCTGDKTDAAKKGESRRMIRRGPAFRARSWIWPAETDAAVGAAPVSAPRTASSGRRAPKVRVFRAMRRKGFSSRYARCDG